MNNTGRNLRETLRTALLLTGTSAETSVGQFLSELDAYDFVLETLFEEIWVKQTRTETLEQYIQNGYLVDAFEASLFVGCALAYNDLCLQSNEMKDWIGEPMFERYRHFCLLLGVTMLSRDIHDPNFQSMTPDGPGFWAGATASSEADGQNEFLERLLWDDILRR